jgi:hypothetical protein
MAKTLIRLFEDSSKLGVCRGCGAAIAWFDTLAGKKMPMNAGAVAVRRETDRHSDRDFAFFSSADSHWNTCPDIASFKKKATLVRAYFSADYVPATNRWHWIILVNDRSHSKEIARSVPSYPTEHDANVAAKDVQLQLKNATVEAVSR